MENKVKNGQFYTIRNPFDNPLFKEWVNLIDDIGEKTFVEPFGGSNNIVKLFLEVFSQVSLSQWESYDLEPEAVISNTVPELKLIQRDTIKNPVLADVIITNPPYLAKNSATRLGIKQDFRNFQDLYEVSIDVMLDNAGYVAAIVPESFLTRKLFKDRLYGFISITECIFDDTEFPVGIALWVPEKTDDFVVFSGSEKIGNFKEVEERTALFAFKEKIESENIFSGVKVQFNDPGGVLGLYAVDGTKSNSIRFVRGETIDKSLIKVSSRAITKITVLGNNGHILVEDNIDEFIKVSNSVIEAFRDETCDIFLTSFKGLRKDGRYRRRLDFKLTRLIVFYSLYLMGVVSSEGKDNVLF